MVNGSITIKRLLGLVTTEREVRFAAAIGEMPLELRVPRQLWSKAITDGDGPLNEIVVNLPRRALRLIEAEASFQMMMGNLPIKSVLSLSSPSHH